MNQLEHAAVWAQFHAKQRRARRLAKARQIARVIGFAGLIAAALVIGYAVSLIPAKIAATVLEAQEERPKW